LNLDVWFVKSGQGAILHGQIGLNVMMGGGRTLVASRERDDDVDRAFGVARYDEMGFIMTSLSGLPLQTIIEIMSS
jgi:uridylate kinase